VEVIYTLEYTKQAVKDIQKLKAAKLGNKGQALCTMLALDSTPVCSKELYHDLKGKRSIRINIQHRLVYEILEDKKIIKILSMWGHYE
jgi:toxin YoeB